MGWARGWAAQETVYLNPHRESVQHHLALGQRPFGNTSPRIEQEDDGDEDENEEGEGKFTYNLRFPGQYFDKKTGLHYNYFRDYNPGTAR